MGRVSVVRRVSNQPTGLQVGNHIDILSKKWVAQDAGIGAGVDSYFEYLVKGAIMLQDEELLDMFLGEDRCTLLHHLHFMHLISRPVLSEYDRAIQNYTRFDDWYLWVQMHKGTVSMPVFQSLEAFWPGLQVDTLNTSTEEPSMRNVGLNKPDCVCVF